MPCTVWNPEDKVSHALPPLSKQQRPAQSQYGGGQWGATALEGANVSVPDLG
jgi:hypothetical protein